MFKVTSALTLTETHRTKSNIDSQQNKIYNISFWYLKAHKRILTNKKMMQYNIRNQSYLMAYVLSRMKMEKQL